MLMGVLNVADVGQVVMGGEHFRGYKTSFCPSSEHGSAELAFRRQLPLCE